MIEQLSSLTSELATFTLALPTETDNAVINKRTILVTCSWVYRSSECGYTGGAVADEKDQPTTDLKKDKGIVDKIVAVLPKTMPSGQNSC